MNTGTIKLRLPYPQPMFSHWQGKMITDSKTGYRHLQHTDYPIYKCPYTSRWHKLLTITRQLDSQNVTYKVRYFIFSRGCIAVIRYCKVFWR